MRIRGWLDTTTSYIQEEGVVTGTQYGVRDLLFGIYHNVPYSIGTPVYEMEWDVLVILDALRYDVLKDVGEGYDFLPDTFGSVYSVASSSARWMERTFDTKYRPIMRETAYVTGNPYSQSHLDSNDFALLDEVWRYAWDDEVGSVPADAITDRAIEVGRTHEYERLMIHYMQPHFPSFPKPVAGGVGLDDFGHQYLPVWELLENGDLDVAIAWESYKANTRYVLDSVGELIRNLDGDTVIITSDHGNAFGEWGVYGHPVDKPLPVLRKVPWVPVEADDLGYRTPSTIVDHDRVDTDVEARLRDLGYR